MEEGEREGRRGGGRSWGEGGEGADIGSVEEGEGDEMRELVMSGGEGGSGGRKEEMLRRDLSANGRKGGERRGRDGEEGEGDEMIE